MQDMEKIYEEYFETVNKYLFCLTHNNDISEELTQETFYKAVKKIDTYKGECKMSVWLCQIAKNLWYDQCRKNKKFVDTKEVDLLNVQALNTLEEQVISNDEKISLYKKMQYLDEKTREVMYLRITGELSFKEIGICKIVQDLLPNYIENLTNEETNRFIEEHLKECPECQKVLENMQKEIKVSTTKRDDREVKYIKKYNKKLKILKYALLIIILIYVIAVGRRTIIMSSLSGKATENQINDNYYVRLYSYRGDTLTITESYNKGEDYLTTLTRVVNGSNIQKITYYKKGEEQLFIIESDGKKNILNSETMLGGHILPVTYVSNGILANLQYALITGIDSTYCNGKECYVIKGNSYERYIDKETGLAVRNIEKSNKEITRKNDAVVDYEYKFNIVKDSDIVKPDTTGYIVNE